MSAQNLRAQITVIGSEGEIKKYVKFGWILRSNEKGFTERENLKNHNIK